MNDAISSDGSRYIHGSSPPEQERLALLNRIMNDACLTEMKLQGGEHILDVGSGLGQLTRLMARSAGRRAVGVERSAAQLESAQALARAAGETSLVEFRRGEADQLPLEKPEWGSFDVVHARFLLEHVPNPLEVVRAMIQAARPGGRIILLDDDHDVLRFWPEPPGVMQVWQHYVRSYDRLGNDPYVGRRLVWLLQHAGAIPTRNTWVFFGACSGSEHFHGLIDNFREILIGAREVMLGQCTIDEKEFATALGHLKEWQARPDAAFWYAMSWAEGVRPNSICL